MVSSRIPSLGLPGPLFVAKGLLKIACVDEATGLLPALLGSSLDLDGERGQRMSHFGGRGIKQGMRKGKKKGMLMKQGEIDCR